VATESGVDRSKSIKSHLLQLFNRQPPQPSTPNQTAAAAAAASTPSGSHRGGGGWAGLGPPSEGTDMVHACYGGTAALLAAAAWVESRRWDGRLAMVVAADVALYAPGSAARPTGGCGAVALLVGPSAPLVLDPLWYGSHSEHAYDFYKPLGDLPYPTVDGRLTLSQYLGAAGACAAA
ncbi:Hydroxymethylglutaryl-CoA synthase, cytoplasmic, partial [Tetrabaena socialis]